MRRVKFGLDIDAAKMHEWLLTVVEWEDYDWSNIVTEFEAMVQAFVHHVYEMDNRDCYLKVFSRWGWSNWKFSKPLKQKTFTSMVACCWSLPPTRDRFRTLPPTQDSGAVLSVLRIATRYSGVKVTLEHDSGALHIRGP